ncbi:MAG TPA: hypothetical protein ENI26_00950 [Methylophaga aminisulfidivorans]|uniref:Uncharacterized protein n=2 Tax=root TaxID=1 RepID=A0A7C1VVP2_9GAMM|nr:hypothetical protein [Methylophaga aminisulfidivorans]
MSDVKQLNLTTYGCPLHYIKAREAIQTIDVDQSINFLVNTGEAVNEVLNSLTNDGQQCEITSNDVLTTTISVRRKK